jgi:serine phosphatase RsbU (regulator of sigma subunit)
MDISVDSTLEHGYTIRPCRGESLSGDAVIARTLDAGIFMAIVDVLGHGPEAHELTHIIDSYLSRYGCWEVTRVITQLHQHLKGTRGAAVGMCAINASTGRLDYAGIGNTSIRRFGTTETRLVSHDGVLGQNMRTPLPQSVQLADGDLVVLYTDGVSDRFTAEQYPGMAHHPPAEIAKNIVQRFGKDHDDAACVAVRYNA